MAHELPIVGLDARRYVPELPSNEEKCREVRK